MKPPERPTLGIDAILVILATGSTTALARTLMACRPRRNSGLDALVEVHDDSEMARASALGADLAGINNRDLRTFTVTLETTERLAALAPAGALLVAESGIFTNADAARVCAAGARAMLVGESLMRQADVAAATRALPRWGRPTR